MQRIFWIRRKSIAPATQNDFWRVMKHAGMSRSATLATQNDITTCFETFNKERFCSVPHRHCDGTTEASDSRRDMLDHQNKHFTQDVLTFHTSQLQNRRFPTSFLANRPQNRRFLRGLPSIFVTCHKMPRLPRNLHLVTTSRSADNAIRGKTRNTTRLECCAWHAKWHRMSPKCCSCDDKMQRIFWKLRKRYCACPTKRLFTRHETCWYVTKCRACHVKWSCCERLRTVVQRRSNTAQPPPPEWNGNTCYAFGKRAVFDTKYKLCPRNHISQQIPISLSTFVLFWPWPRRGYIPLPHCGLTMIRFQAPSNLDELLQKQYLD